jgi:hypothetical protein
MSHQHRAEITYNSHVNFNGQLAALMFNDPKSLVHGAHHGRKLARHGINEHSNLRADRGPKLPDGTYDQQTIRYNISHAAEMIAQHLKSHAFQIGLESCTDRDEEPIIRKLTGDVVIDAIGPVKVDIHNPYELSHLRFHVGETCIELTLYSFGFNYEKRHYSWFVTHVYDQYEEYDYHDDLLYGTTPKYVLKLTL